MNLGAAASVIASVPQLAAFLEAGSVHTLAAAPDTIDGVVGWGLKPSARRGELFAARHGKPFWRVEDGFLRSIALGKSGAPSISLVVDDLGIYYDARQPSRLEALLLDGGFEALHARAAALRERIVDARLSKYNHEPDIPLQSPRSNRRRILLVDQVAGDLSIPGACASPETFRQMLHAARNEQPDAELLVRPHPDVRAGLAPSALAATAQAMGLTILDQPLAAHAMLDAVDEVWTVSSQLGFDALLRQQPVTCFGVPFYAGWGLTTDRPTLAAAQAALQRRTARRCTLDDLVAAALLTYSRYADPVRRRAITAEDAVERLQFWRAQVETNAGRARCSGFSRWKRPIAQAYLGGPRSELRFESRAPRKPLLPQTSAAQEHLYAWGMSPAPENAKLFRVEDGFIRSAGLGSDFRFPMSWCVDSAGMYYDATRPSDLERILETHPFPDDLQARAQDLIRRLVEHGVSKYNLPAADAIQLPGLRDGQPVILVPGQVPGDASLRYGACTVGSNLELLRAVRTHNPDAYIVYKEHPELLSGNRRGGLASETYSSIANLIVTEGGIVPWLERCDEVHVMTSLTGFEALLRGKSVQCWGLPFYAGWGLTRDQVHCLRRTRRLSLAQLVAGTLILYPRYVDPHTRLPCTPEDAVSLLIEARSAPPERPLRRSPWRTAKRGLRYLQAQLRGAR
jgi:capsular polysaccharide export protein